MSSAIDTGSARRHHSSTDPQQHSGLVISLLLIGAIWLVAIVAAGAAGVFEAGRGRQPWPILVAIVGPPLLFGIAYRVAPGFRRFVLALDQRILTAVQAWRVLGGSFLLLYGLALLPALFAFPAGLGDVAVGVAAVFVLRAMLNSHPNWRRQVLLLNIGGLLDFVGAIGTGVLTSNSSLGIFVPAAPMASMGLLPLSLIPTFLVPLWTIAHIASMLQLRHARPQVV
jgi:hypothetical protein